MEQIPQETTIDFEEDLNKPDDKKFAKGSVSWMNLLRKSEG